MGRPRAADGNASSLIRSLLPAVLIALFLAVAACASATSSSTPGTAGTQAGDAAGEDTDGEVTDEPTTPVDRAARDAFLEEFFTEDEFSADEASGDGEEEEIILVTYQVQGDLIANPVEEPVAGDLVDLREDTLTQEEIWEFFVGFMPQSQRELIAEFVIFTDGTDNVVAAADLVSEAPEGWSIEIDIADASDRAELTYNLLHEYAHVLTLNGTQFAPDGGGDATYQSEEEWTTGDSYLNLFYQQFWADIYSEWELAYDEDYLDEFYEEHTDEFLTDYAATEPEEDIAESWLYFVISERPEEGSIAQQKIDFFYDFPELVSLREQIRDNLYLYLINQ